MAERTKWTKDKIRDELLSVIQTLNLDRMPTRKEIISVKGDDRLTNKVSKTLGYYGWAKELNLPMKDNDTNKGKAAEKLVCDLLNSKGYSAKQMLQNYPYDLLVDNTVKIDVKFSNLYHGENGNFYAFALRKKYPTCDIYVLVANNGDERKIYIVPAFEAAQTQISIGEHTSVYDKYIDRYDIIDRLIEIKHVV